MNADSPFDSIESAQQYLRLLATEVESVIVDIEGDAEEAARHRATRRLDALQVVDYKLKQLSQQLSASLCILNDLGMLRRLLVVEEAGVVGEVEGARGNALKDFAGLHEQAKPTSLSIKLR